MKTFAILAAMPQCHCRAGSDFQIAARVMPQLYVKHGARASFRLMLKHQARRCKPRERGCHPIATNPACGVFTF